MLDHEIPSDTYRLLVEESLVGVYMIQDDRLVYANPKFIQLFGYSREELCALPSVLDLIAPSDREMVRETIRKRLTGEIGVIEYTVHGVRKNRSPIVMDVRSVRGMHGGRPAVMGTVVDITARKQAEEALRALALVDELTGVYNRRGFLTLAERQLTVARRKGQALVLLAADVDNLKTINDMHGHAAGDDCLVAAATVLKTTYREADIVARLGGDEFTVFPLDATTGSISLMIGRLETNIRRWNEENRRPFTLSITTGSAVLEGDLSKGVQQLLAEADSQLYRHKRERFRLPIEGDLRTPFWASDSE